MNLYLRLLWIILTARWRSVGSGLGPCRTSFRVLPTDLDVLRHVNNGVYLSLMDLGRLDLMHRAGMAKQLVARGWYPVVVAETIQFRRSLTLFQRFEVETRVLSWDNKAFLLGQRFLRGDQTIAHALVRARFLSRSGERVTPADILPLVGYPPLPPAPPDWAARWNADQATWRDIDQSATAAESQSSRRVLGFEKNPE